VNQSINTVWALLKQAGQIWSRIQQFCILDRDMLVSRHTIAKPSQQFPGAAEGVPEGSASEDGGPGRRAGGAAEDSKDLSRLPQGVCTLGTRPSSLR